MRAVVVMGVAGVGKTSVGRALAARLGWEFFDGDDFHGDENRRKMAAGEPLTDDDRWPWLDRLAALIAGHLSDGAGTVLACSALRRAYRERLGISDPRVAFVHLRGDRDVVEERLRKRRGHYMPPSLLDSQYATLEEPQRAVTVDVDAELEAVVDAAVTGLAAVDRERALGSGQAAEAGGTNGRRP